MAVPARLTLSQPRSFTIHRTTLLNYIKFADLLKKYPVGCCCCSLTIVKLCRDRGSDQVTRSTITRSCVELGARAENAFFQHLLRVHSSLPVVIKSVDRETRYTKAEPDSKVKGRQRDRSAQRPLNATNRSFFFFFPLFFFSSIQLLYLLNVTAFTSFLLYVSYWDWSRIEFSENLWNRSKITELFQPKGVDFDDWPIYENFSEELLLILKW